MAIELNIFRGIKLFKCSFISTRGARALEIIASRLFSLDTDQRKC
jgi:hypothetical protein